MTEQQPDVPAVPGVTRYRVREPVTIEAIKWTGGNEEAVRAFAGGWWDGSMPPCYVARGITGHLFTVDAGRFAAIYEPAGEPLSSTQCDRLRQMATDRGNAVQAVRDALDLTEARAGGHAEIIAAAREALKTLSGEEDAPAVPAPPLAAALDREDLGRLVREVWVACAREHPSPKPSWLVPWDELGEWDRETDRRIGASVAAHAAAVTAVRMHELSAADRAMAAHATGGGIRSREVLPVFDDEEDPDDR